MIERVTGGKVLPPEVVEQIVAKTDGVPLFVEELTKMVVESGVFTAVTDHYELSGPLPPLAIPATLQDSLMARLDRLSTVREIAQLGATLGREFDYELIHAVSPFGEERLQQGLKQLVEAELVYQRGLPPQATYLFKHALIQEVAYQSLLKSTRQHYHQQIARVLEDRFPETLETQPELLAHHYTEAGLTAQAIPAWQQAGQRAIDRSAHVEAIGHLTKGLAVLKALPETPERAQHELRLQLALSTPLATTKGLLAPEVDHACRRAHALCQQLGETPQLIPVLGRLQGLYLYRGELQTARTLAEQLLGLAQRVGQPFLLVGAHLALGFTLGLQGELVAARAHLEQSLARYDPQQHWLSVVALDPQVTGLAALAQVLHALGYPDHARQRSQEALTRARALAHLYSLATVFGLAAELHRRRGEPQAARALAEEGIPLAREQGFTPTLTALMLERGWALAVQGRGEGIAQIHQGLTTFQSAGPYRRLLELGLLAEAYGKVGQPEEGLNVLAEALALVNKTEVRGAEAELYWLKGELTLQSKVPGPKGEVEEEAEEWFYKAIEVARLRQAKSLELRAVMSLSRLWQHQGKKAEARRLLAEIYNWFTEGFDTKDLQEAKALLEELN